MSSVQNLIENLQVLRLIQFDDLELNKKYKVYEVKALKSESNQTDFYIRIKIEIGYLIFPERYSDRIICLNEINVERLYMIYNGCNNENSLNLTFLEE